MTNKQLIQHLLEFPMNADIHIRFEDELPDSAIEYDMEFDNFDIKFDSPTEEQAETIILAIL
jgi:hypothetical protein